MSESNTAGNEAVNAVGGDQKAGWRRGFWSLFATQFQGAFSDNAFKFVVMFLVMAGMTRDEKDALAPVIGAVFALPFIIAFVRSANVRYHPFDISVLLVEQN